MYYIYCQVKHLDPSKKQVIHLDQDVLCGTWWKTLYSVWWSLSHLFIWEHGYLFLCFSLFSHFFFFSFLSFLSYLSFFSFCIAHVSFCKIAREGWIKFCSMLYFHLVATEMTDMLLRTFNIKATYSCGVYVSSFLSQLSLTEYYIKSY